MSRGEVGSVMNKLTRGVAAGAILVAVTLTGCSRPPSAAAIVEGQRISDATVGESATVLSGMGVLSDPSTAPSSAAWYLVVGNASMLIAEKEGVTVTDGDLDQVIAQDSRLQSAASTPEGSTLATAIAQQVFVLQAVGQDTYLQDLGQLDIEINPRYGQWDPTTYQIVSSSLATDISS